MRRKTVVARAIEAQEGAPITAWVIWGGAMVALGFRVAGHDGGTPEDWKHLLPDGVLLAIALVAAPGFMKYASGNAARAIDLYRRFKGVRESKSEDRAPGSGGGGQE